MAVNTNKLLNTIDERYSSIEVIDWHGIEIKCKKYLSLEDEEIFINTCVKACFDDNGEYTPNHCDFCIKLATLKLYTDIDLPDDIESINKIINMTDIIESAMSVINNHQYDEIIESVTKKINYLINLKEGEIYSETNKLVRSIEKITKSLEDSFGDIDKDGIGKLISAISNKNINEKEIVNAVMESINGRN